MHFDKSELGRAVDRDKQVELALYRPTIFWPL
jgi:hypothetical protein